MLRADLSLYKNTRVCVALSGGADSVALLCLFCDAAPAYGIALSAVHVEHGIRGRESEEDAAFVRALCKEQGVPLRLVRADIPARAKEAGVGLEEAARLFRRGVFYRLLKAGAADYVATAHHAGDNAESVLLHLFRGAALTGAGGIRAFVPAGALADGAEGVNEVADGMNVGADGMNVGAYGMNEVADGMNEVADGMNEVADGPAAGLPFARRGLVRPFLACTRAEIVAYLRGRGRAWREDATNADTAYARNFVRRAVLGSAKEVFPAAEKNLYAFSRLAREDDDFLFAEAARILRRGRGGYAVAADAPRPLFLRACVLALRALGVQKDYTYANFQDVFALAEGKTGRRADLPCGVCAVKEYGQVVLYRPQAAAGSYPLAEGVFGFGPFSVRAFRAPAPPAFSRGAFPRTLYLAGDAEGELRLRREGDRFTPFGGGDRKLKEFFIDKKIPRRERDLLPVLAAGSRVLAVCGVEIAEQVKTDPARPADVWVLETIYKGED